MDLYENLGRHGNWDYREIKVNIVFYVSLKEDHYLGNIDWHANLGWHGNSDWHVNIGRHGK